MEHCACEHIELLVKILFITGVISKQKMANKTLLTANKRRYLEIEV